MSTAGIIAEYNPFHNGHLYQAEQIRSTLGCEHIISVMSGDYIQRGLPAVCSKYLRADMTVSNGIDAVFELPMVFATASAGDFAFAGVSLLEKLHAVDYLVFGFIDEFNFFKAARYSIARILFGSAITGTASGKRPANAFARAAG